MCLYNQQSEKQNLIAYEAAYGFQTAKSPLIAVLFLAFSRFGKDAFVVWDSMRVDAQRMCK